MTSPRWRQMAIAGHTVDEAAARDGLTDVDQSTRELALGALARMQRLTDEDVERAFCDPAAAVRRRAALIAATRPSIDPTQLFADPDETVVEAAAWACGEQVRFDAVPPLVALATGASQPLVREAAVASLGAIGDERGLPAILAACSDKPAVRRRAVLALAPFSGPDVDEALNAALSDRDWQVRQSAEDIVPQAGTV